MALHVTGHAIERFQERIANIPDDEVRSAIDSPVVRAAASFGAPYVRLPSGHRIVLDGHTVVTVLPKMYSTGCLHGRAVKEDRS